GRHVDGMAARLDRLNRCAGGNAPHHGHRHRTSAFVLGRRAYAAEVALYDARREAARPASAVPVGLLDHFDGTRAIWQPPDEAALLERRDQAVDAGFRAQVEGVLHLVERGGNAGLGQALVDEAQEFELLASQHASDPPSGAIVTYDR